MKFVTLDPALSVLSLVTFELPAPAMPSTLGNFFQNATRRAKLVRVLRRAFVAFSEAGEVHNEIVTDYRANYPLIAASEKRCRHLLHRYEALEAVLAEESGLSKSSVYHSIANGYPLCSGLLRAGL